MITKKELMEWLNISHMTVDRMIKKGSPSYKTSNTKCGQLRFDKEEVKEWLRNNTVLEEE